MSLSHHNTSVSNYKEFLYHFILINKSKLHSTPNTQSTTLISLHISTSHSIFLKGYLCQLTFIKRRKKIPLIFSYSQQIWYQINDIILAKIKHYSLPFLITNFYLRNQTLKSTVQISLSQRVCERCWVHSAREQNSFWFFFFLLWFTLSHLSHSSFSSSFSSSGLVKTVEEVLIFFCF